MWLLATFALRMFLMPAGRVGVCRNVWPLGCAVTAKVGAKFSMWVRKRFVNAYFAFENEPRAKES